MLQAQCDDDLDAFFFFKQKTAYEITHSDWSSDVCSSDLIEFIRGVPILVLLFTTAYVIVPQMYSMRSEERRVGKERCALCRFRWSPNHQKKNHRVPVGMFGNSRLPGELRQVVAQ